MADLANIPEAAWREAERRAQVVRPLLNAGYRPRGLIHTRRKAHRWWPGWEATLVELPPEVLVSEARSRTYEGLWLREPGQFMHDALPRAHTFLDRFPPPPV